jgi:hypothetical protein
VIAVVGLLCCRVLARRHAARAAAEDGRPKLLRWSVLAARQGVAARGEEMTRVVIGTITIWWQGPLFMVTWSRLELELELLLMLMAACLPVYFELDGLIPCQRGVLFLCLLGFGFDLVEKRIGEDRDTAELI